MSEIIICDTCEGLSNSRDPQGAFKIERMGVLQTIGQKIEYHVCSEQCGMRLFHKLLKERVNELR